MIQIAIIIVIVLISSGLFSGSETVLVSISQAYVEQLEKEQKAGWRVLKFIKTHIDKSVMAILIMNNIVNIAGSVMVGNTVANLYGDAALAAVTTGLTFAVILFSEIIPKSLGMHYRKTFAVPCAYFVRCFYYLLFPLIFLLEKLTTKLKSGEAPKVGTEDEIRNLVNIGRREGHIESDEGQIIHRAFILNDKTAEQVMTPLKDIEGLESTTTFRKAAEEASSLPYSRYPVFGDSIHDIIGTLLAKDVLSKIADNNIENDDDLITTIMRDPLVVPHHMPCDELLPIFRKEETHMAVVQQDGDTIGIVTLEDVLEELVGEIQDETDE